jgi:hypothetical protein
MFVQAKKGRALTRNFESFRVLPVITADQLTRRGTGDRSRRRLEGCGINGVDWFLYF